MTKTVLIGIARMGSTRLPGKVLKDLGGLPVISWVVRAGQAAKLVDEVWIATSTLPADDAIEDWCRANGISCFRGDETDVLSRFTGAAQASKADVAVRVTCDCPFLDPNVIDEVVTLRAALGAAYASNIDPPTWPDGLDCEAILVEALEVANKYATRPTDRECVTTYITRNRHVFLTANLTCPIPGLHKERWVLDMEDDYLFCQKLAEGMPDTNYLAKLGWLNGHPWVRDLNKAHPRNERFFESISKEQTERHHDLSRGMLQEVSRTIPLGTQTFSKSYLQYPQEAPLYVTHGDGGRVFDVDGNDYVDLVGGLLPNILGYRDPDVDFAIRQQLDNGISFSLASPLEYRLAEKLVGLIPCAEMVRFGKNGTDVTTAAVRLARRCTGRDQILTSGYHGWNDWSIARDSVRNAGVPQGVRDLTSTLIYGDITGARGALETKQYACCIVEPETDARFLKQLRTICNATGTLLIFDEIITGFRFHLGGAQSIHGVTPDLACFGKSMANGMPLSFLCGHRKYMKEMTEVCFSGTFFGETLSLAAALATINKMEREKVLEKIREKNRSLITYTALAQSVAEVHVMDVVGEYLPRLKFLSVGRYEAEDIKTLFMQEMIKNGVLVIGSYNLCYAHTDADLSRVAAALAATFQTIKRALASGDLKQFIIGAAIERTANVRYAS